MVTKPRIPAACAIASSNSTPGKHGLPRKVSVKKWLVNAEILVGQDSLTRLNRNHSVDQKKRVSMREPISNLFNIQYHALSSSWCAAPAAFSSAAMRLAS